MVKRHYIRTAPKGGGLGEVLRSFAGLIPFFAAFFAAYVICDFLFLRNTVQDIAASIDYEGAVNFGGFISDVVGLIAALSVAYLSFYLLYMAYRKSPMFLYWIGGLALFVYPMILAFFFYTDAISMADGIGGEEASERLKAFAAFVENLKVDLKIETASDIAKYAVAASAFLIVFWFAPLSFTYKRVAAYHRRFKVYGDIDKPVRELTSIEYAARRREIRWAFAGIVVFTILSLLFTGIISTCVNEDGSKIYGATDVINIVLMIACTISAIILFYRIWRAIPQEISKMSATKIIVLMFIPIADIFAKYKLTIGVMRGMNRSFESLGYRGFRSNTIIAICFWAVVLVCGIGLTAHMFYLFSLGGDANAEQFKQEVARIPTLWNTCTAVCMILFLIMAGKMSMTATTLLQAFEYTKQQNSGLSQPTEVK